jgi:hypothetical protein
VCKAEETGWECKAQEQESEARTGGNNQGDSGEAEEDDSKSDKEDEHTEDEHAEDEHVEDDESREGGVMDVDAGGDEGPEGGKRGAGKGGSCPLLHPAFTKRNAPTAAAPAAWAINARAQLIDKELGDQWAALLGLWWRSEAASGFGTDVRSCLCVDVLMLTLPSQKKSHKPDTRPLEIGEWIGQGQHPRYRSVKPPLDLGGHLRKWWVAANPEWRRKLGPDGEPLEVKENGDLLPVHRRLLSRRGSAGKERLSERPNGLEDVGGAYQEPCSTAWRCWRMWPGFWDGQYPISQGIQASD